MTKYEDNYGISPRVWSKAYLKRDLTEKATQLHKANIEFSVWRLSHKHKLGITDIHEDQNNSILHFSQYTTTEAAQSHSGYRVALFIDEANSYIPKYAGLSEIERKVANILFRQQKQLSIDSKQPEVLRKKAKENMRKLNPNYMRREKAKAHALCKERFLLR
ncbi:hypothetical protein [Lactobacillus gasseri]|jgi:hypothetical protein|nr:hypothetical protein [Lactobacillus gasseri]MCZ3850712.1 hypothetical protein [Lactobacillus gasseri]MCZ3852575.1 hypothetical protein [Lactobacillus gasseri]MCZ3861179.1 hypothetical protein [Lactobacillus gasseri]MCZ3893689.1 hypothetical protein [Lactobacillus gasseri]MCZ3895604.1 hypothetical protein [Lactobacillus gasseri]